MCLAKNCAVAKQELSDHLTTNDFEIPNKYFTFSIYYTFRSKLQIDISGKRHKSNVFPGVMVGVSNL
jgi:hypothetical protein